MSTPSRSESHKTDTKGTCRLIGLGRPMARGGAHPLSGVGNDDRPVHAPPSAPIVRERVQEHPLSRGVRVSSKLFLGFIMYHQFVGKGSGARGAHILNGLNDFVEVPGVGGCGKDKQEEQHNGVAAGHIFDGRKFRTPSQRLQW